MRVVWFVERDSMLFFARWCSGARAFLEVLMVSTLRHLETAEIRATIPGAVAACWHEHRQQAGPTALPQPLSADEIERALPLHIRQGMVRRSYSLLAELKRFCRGDDPLLYSVRAYGRDDLFVPAWAPHAHYELVLTPRVYLTALALRLLQSGQHPIPSTVLWEHCQADPLCPVKDRTQLQRIVASPRASTWQHSSFIGSDSFVYLPTVPHQTFLQFLQLDWVWSLAQWDQEVRRLEHAQQPLLRQARWRLLQHTVTTFLSELDALAPSLPAVLAVESASFRRQLTQLRDQCQAQLAPGAVPPLAPVAPVTLTAEALKELVRPFDPTLRPSLYPSEMYNRFAAQIRRHYPARPSRLASAAEAVPHVTLYDRVDAWLFVAETYGGTRTRSYAYFVRCELGWWRDPALLLPWLDSSDSFERRLALCGLAFLAPPHLSGLFWQLALHDPDPETRWAALWALQLWHGTLPLGLSTRALTRLQASPADLALRHQSAFRW